MDTFKELFEDIKDEAGARSQELLETMTRSDLPYLLAGTAMDRALLKAYREYPADWEQYVAIEPVRDFRTVERLYEYGGDGSLSEVAEQEPYKYDKIQEGKYTFSVAKYGRKLSFSWESLINDDLSALKRIPEKLARAARRTEQKLITSLFVDASGPKSALFNAGSGGFNLGTAKLSITSLAAAFTSIGDQTDPNGEPFFVSRFHLVVPPALEITAKSILEAIELVYPDTQGVAENYVNYKTNNWMKQRLTLHVNPYLPVIDETSGDTAWYIFPDPSEIFCMVLARLRGHEEPEIFMKNPNAIKIGGGQDPFNGDFDYDSVEYKVRHVCGAAVADYRGSYASTGAA
mgnify:FL=1